MSGSQECIWSSLPGPRAHGPPAHAHTQTRTQLIEETKPHFVSTAARRHHLGNLVLADKKEREYLDAYIQTQQNQNKYNKNKPHPLWSSVMWEPLSRNWTSFLYLPERHMTGSYSCTMLSLNSASEGNGEKGGDGEWQQGRPCLIRPATSDERGFCKQNY